MKPTRYYQAAAKEAVENGLKRNITNQLLCMATGTGKTYTAVQVIKNKGRCLWGTHEEGLLSQSATALLSELELMPDDQLLHIINTHGDIIELVRNANRGSFFNDPNTTLIANNIGIIKADLFDIDKPIVMASMQTLWRRLDKIPFDHFQVMVVDEAHLSGSKTWIKSIRHFQCDLKLFLTATPFRSDGMLMGDVADEIIYEYPIDQAIKDGFLCELDAVRIKTNINLDKIRTIGGELNQSDLEVTVNTPERNALIVEKYIQYGSGRQFIAFAVDVKHAQDLTEAFKHRGLSVNFIVGDKELTPNRKKVLTDYRSGHYIGLVNVGVLVAGADFPNTGCIIQACPTKSLVKYLQSVGRGTRLKNQLFITRFGQNCIILDFIDSTTKHRLVNTWTLDKAKPPEDRTFLTKEKREKLIADRERRFKLEQLEKDIRVNLLKLPTVKISNSIRMQEPATQGQLDWIAREGYDIVNLNYTKKMCSDIISNLPASEKQAWVLAKKGYDVSQGVTVGEAKLAFLEIEEREAKAKSEALKKANKFPFNDIF